MAKLGLGLAVAVAFAIFLVVCSEPVSGCLKQGYSRFNGVCYKYFADRKTYDEAGQTCATDGGMLAMPKDSVTNTFIAELGNGENRWTGLTDAVSEGQWMFEDGRTLESTGYSNWKVSKPNGGTRENCAAIHPQTGSTWLDVGCNVDLTFICQIDQACLQPLGMESGAIPDDSITASSFWSAGREPYRGRLNGVAGEGGWAVSHNTIGQWLQVDLGSTKCITGTIIQGRANGYFDKWVTSYILQFSQDTISWTAYKGSDGAEKVFHGNTDRNTPVTNLMNPPVDTRYVRFYPQAWNYWISMRAEILGCNRDTQTTTALTSSTALTTRTATTTTTTTTSTTATTIDSTTTAITNVATAPPITTNVATTATTAAAATAFATTTAASTAAATSAAGTTTAPPPPTTTVDTTASSTTATTAAATTTAAAFASAATTAATTTAAATTATATTAAAATAADTTTATTTTAATTATATTATTTDTNTTTGATTAAGTTTASTTTTATPTAATTTADITSTIATPEKSTPRTTTDAASLESSAFVSTATSTITGVSEDNVLAEAEKEWKTVLKSMSENLPAFKSALISEDHATQAEWNQWKAGERMPRGYDKNASPQTEEKFEVTSAVTVLHVGPLSEESANLSVTVEYTMAWVDPRLRGLTTHWTPVPASRMWAPPLAFGAAVRRAAGVTKKTKRGRGGSDPDISLWLHPFGGLVHRLTRTLYLTCVPSMARYPLDQQQCSFKLHGYGGLYFPLLPGKNASSPGPVTTDMTAIVSQFELTGLKVHSSIQQMDKTEPACHLLTGKCAFNADHCPDMRGCSQGYKCAVCKVYFGSCQYKTNECKKSNISGLSEISTLDVRLQFSRRLQSHVLQTFLPTASVVCTSWISTWLHPREVNARVGLGISTLLSLIIKSSKDRNPLTNLVRAYDVWMIGCLVVVMLTLLETVLVNYIFSGGKLALRSTRVEPVPRPSTAWAGEEEDEQCSAVGEANRVDLFARIVFPVIFVAFLIGYFTYYA